MQTRTQTSMCACERFYMCVCMCVRASSLVCARVRALLVAAPDPSGSQYTWIYFCMHMHLCVYVHPSNLSPARAKARVSKSYIYVYVYICMYSMRGRVSVHPSIICPNPMEAKIITHLRSADKVFVRFSGRLGLFWLTARRLYIPVESHVAVSCSVLQCVAVCCSVL